MPPRDIAQPLITRTHRDISEFAKAKLCPVPSDGVSAGVVAVYAEIHDVWHVGVAAAARGEAERVDLAAFVPGALEVEVERSNALAALAGNDGYVDRGGGGGEEGGEEEGGEVHFDLGSCGWEGGE